jgi:hypothetical protein
MKTAATVLHVSSTCPGSNGCDLRGAEPCAANGSYNNILPLCLFALQEADCVQLLSIGLPMEQLQSRGAGGGGRGHSLLRPDVHFSRPYKKNTVPSQTIDGCTTDRQGHGLGKEREYGMQAHPHSGSLLASMANLMPAPRSRKVGKSAWLSSIHAYPAILDRRAACLGVISGQRAVGNRPNSAACCPSVNQM